MEPPLSAHVPPPTSITITGDLICIGDRRFHLKCGGARVSDAESLERVKSLIEKHFNVTEISSAMQGLQGASATEVCAPFRIRLTDQGAQVSRVEASGSSSPSSQIISCKEQATLTRKELANADQVQQNYQRRLEKIQREFTDVSKIAQELTRQLESKGYSSDEVRQAITMIFEEGHLFMSGEMPEWGEKTVADLLHEPGNEALLQALKKVKETYSYSPETTRSFFGKRTYKKRCAKDIQIFTLKNQKRNIRSVEHENHTTTRQHFVTWKEPVTTMIQRGERINPANSLQTKKSPPSEADKGEYRSEIEDFNTNLGVVGHITQDGSLDHVIATRSGKSDTHSRLQEHVVTSLLHEFASKNPRGIEQLPDGTHTYQAIITSFLDPSTLKAMPERMQALWKKPEDEQEYLFSILRAADEWPPEGYTVAVEKADGSKTEVVLKKPIILNQLFSTTVRGVATQSKRYGDMGQKRSDSINFVPNQLLVQRYLKKLPLDDDSTAFRQVNKALNSELTKALGGDTYLNEQEVIDWEKVSQSKLIKHKDFFSSDAFQDYQMFLAQCLVNRIKTSKNYMQEKALFVTLFRQFPPSQIDVTFTLFPTQDKEMHAADFAIYKNILFHELGIPCAFQCKSGTDRTGLGVALACAQDAYRQKYGKDFDPQLYDYGQDLHFFKEEFRKALKELGIAITVETKGYFGIKWGGGVPLMGGKGNPVAYKYLYLEEDDHQKTDVSGVTTKDLQARGILQYKGKLTDPEGIYKKSSKTYVKALEERKKAHSSQEVRAAIEHVSDFFHTVGEKPSEDLFNEKMQLEVHVRRLHLNRKARNNEQKTRIQLLDEKIKEYEQNTSRTSQQNLELYMLRHVKMLWQARQESKDLHVAQTFAKTMQFSRPATTTISLEEEVRS